LPTKELSAEESTNQERKWTSPAIDRKGNKVLLVTKKGVWAALKTPEAEDRIALSLAYVRNGE